jgi:uncharacterized membrane protein YkvA (DUF1232 family)
VETWLIVVAVVLGVYVLAVMGLLVVGRTTDARALVGFIPDCIVLFTRLSRDDRVSRGRKLLLVLFIAYLAMPLDLIPDFLPVVGQLDDVLLAAIVLRTLLRGGSRELLAEHWPGPERSLRAMVALAGR